eukprot:TRINITY_DN7015_c0_g1_i1.p1 TRINITY_DN7015_c0_g1~~TRINITY_DN7015_c0_g1_i1.p1  ORF type:complete len:343 (-),score=67.69 TRINITY_DN7015_c0_g1_i1:20-1048(-)
MPTTIITLDDEEQCGWRDVSGQSCLFDNDIVLLRKLTHSGHSEDPELSCAGGVAVFRAQIRSTGQLVAVKVCCKCNAHKKRKSFQALCGEDAEDQMIIGFSEDLDQERRMLEAAQSSEHVVQLVKTCEDRRFRYLVTEYLTGGDLFDFISRRRSSDEETARVVISQVLSGLQDLHDAGIAHLDLSLENIVLEHHYSKDGRIDHSSTKVKLIDLGRSRCFTKDQKYLLSRTRGKPNFRSVEISCKQETDPFLADCFSAGVVLFCLVFGRFPFEIPDILRDRDYRRIANSEVAAVIDQTSALLHIPVADDCKAVMESLLCSESSRLSASQALQLPWFQMKRAKI